MTVDDRGTLEALRRRLCHTGAICDLLAAHDVSELGEAVRGISLMLEDGVRAVDAMIEGGR